MKKYFFLFILFVLSLILVINFSDVIKLGSGSVDWILLLIYFLTIYWNKWYGLITAFLLGLFYGNFMSLPAGFYSLMYILIVVFLYFVKRRIFKKKYQSLFLLFMIVFSAGIIELAFLSLTISTFFRYILVSVLPESILTALTGVVVLFIIKIYTHEK